jgi:hypothetical protein
VLKARHPHVHGRHPRVLQVSTTNTLPRDGFSLDRLGQPSTPARDLVVMSRDIAAKYVDDLLATTSNSLII